MQHFLFLFIAIPFVGFLINTIIPRDSEKHLSRVSFITMGIQFVSVFLFTIYWGIQGFPSDLYSKELVVFQSPGFELFIDFAYDKVTAVFLLVGAFIAFLITTFSRNYLHREAGYKRFFNTIMLFYLGYNIIVLSENLTTIFIGWEICGIASFLLIAFYRNRYIPVRNAVKIFSIYKLGDIALILAMWVSHHMWHQIISLLKFGDSHMVIDHIKDHNGLAIAFSVFIILAASIKSAQFPFSSWLPRAMEGPTPSSAIFYSSLSAHLGVFLLLKTYSFWSHIEEVKLLIIVLGAVSFLVATITAKVQPSIKGQIAYSCVAQIGLMFIEIALGWHVLVLIHFASNALLRSYQLLVSPSVVTYLIREQFYTFVPKTRILSNSIVQNFKNSIYVLSLVEWYMDEITHYFMWNGFKSTGKKLRFLNDKMIYIGAAILMIVGFVFYFQKESINQQAFSIVINGLAVVAFIISLRSFTEKKNAEFAWHLLLVSNLFISLSIFLNGMLLSSVLIYLGGIMVSYSVGLWALKRIKKWEPEVDLSGYQGHCYEHPIIEITFLLASLGLMGFPITSAFLGVELIFSNIHLEQMILVYLMSVVMLLNGLAGIRMYARIFLGPHVKTYHESARKSS